MPICVVTLITFYFSFLMVLMFRFSVSSKITVILLFSC